MGCCATWPRNGPSSTTTPSTSWTRSGDTRRSKCPGTRRSGRRSSSTATSTSPPPPGRAVSDTSRRATASPASPTPPPWLRSQTPCRSPRRSEVTIGCLTQVCDRRIYTACLCFGLDLAEQARSGFTYGYSVYQAEYSRNLLFTIGAQMDKVFNRVVDRTRARLDVPILRTLFGVKKRPGRNGTPDLSL